MTLLLTGALFQDGGLRNSSVLFHFFHGSPDDAQPHPPHGGGFHRVSCAGCLGTVRPQTNLAYPQSITLDTAFRFLPPWIPFPRGPHWANERTSALNGAVLQMFNHGINAAALCPGRDPGAAPADGGNWRISAASGHGLPCSPEFPRYSYLYFVGTAGLIGIHRRNSLIFKDPLPVGSGAASFLALPGLMLTPFFPNAAPSAS